MIASLAALPVDFNLSHWAVTGSCPGFFRELVEIAEPFGNGLGVLLVALAVVCLDPLRRRVVPRLLTAALGAGLAADAVKMLVERTRPCAFDFAGTVWDSFGRLLPLASAGSGGQSFPSAHTATAVGLASVLIALYPQGRYLFCLLATMVGLQRVVGGAHFLTDTFCGAALGCVVATWVLDKGRLAAWFDRYENVEVLPERFPRIWEGDTPSEKEPPQRRRAA